MATSAPVTGLHAHLASRADVLASALAGVLGEPLADPFAREIVSVPTPGVERWLGQTLSTRLGAGDLADGVNAGIEFPPLRQLVRDILTTAIGVDADTDPWQPGRLVWPVLATMEDSLDEPWFAVVAEHLAEAGQRPGRRFRIAQRVARVFAGYADQRPEMLRAWARGEAEVPEDLVWQPRLWRAVADRVGDPSGRLAEAVRRLTGDPDVLDLPPRVSVFGPTRLSTTEVQILAAVGTHRAVHLWLPQASPAHWHRVPSGPLGARRPGSVDAGHPLVARLGRDAHELARVLQQVPHTVHEHPDPSAGRRSSLLAAVQADVIAGVAPRGDHEPAAGDTSVQFHACHGPERQVEVLREVVLGLLADDQTLEPRDIVVMCPDIEAYAPHISAAFAGSTLDGVDSHHPVHRIPVRLADRSLRQVNPVLGVLQQLFDLVHGRARAGSLLALCAAEPVARRFRFTAENLDQIAELVAGAEIRWGIDNADVTRHGMGRFQLNTWLAGLDRMLTGVAMPTTRAVGSVTPMDIDSSSMVDLVGRLAELVTRLRRISLDFAGTDPAVTERKPLSEWVASMRRALELVTEVAPTEDWQTHHAFSTLADLADRAGAGGPEVTAADVAELLADAFRGRPTRASFRTGALTMCTLSPMRSVPHRVVVLLGLDDGVFPRSAAAIGDDLLARDPREGERDRPGEDRQLLLDAVMSATDTLAVIWSGKDPASNRPIPMSIPLADVYDAVGLTVREHSRAAWEARHRQHPLQPFSPAYFEGEQPTSFDRHGLAGARALRGPRQAAVRPIDWLATLPPIEVDQVELTDLVSFFADPLKHFLRVRGLPTWEEEVDRHAEELTAELDGLGQWQLNNRVLAALLDDVPPATIVAREARSGKVPPFRVGQALLTTSINDMLDLRATAAQFGGPARTPLPVRLALGSGMFTGAVPVNGVRHLQINPSKRAAKHEMELWLNHLALCAAHPGSDWESVLVAHPDSFLFRLARFRPVAQADAVNYLSELIALYRHGLQRLLPLPPGLAREWQCRNQRRPFDWAGRWKWVDRQTWRKHFADHREFLGTPEPEDSEFVALAQQVWAPLLAHEEQR